MYKDMNSEYSIAWPVVLLFKFEYDMENIHELLIRDLGGRDSWQ